MKLIKGKDILGLKIFTISTGKYIAEVNDVIYDPIIQRVRAFMIGNGGIFADTSFLLLEDVATFGKDALLVANEFVLKKSSDVEPRIYEIAREKNYLTDSEMITENGTRLGKIDDIFFDPNTGKVEEFEVVHSGLINLQPTKKIIKASELITIGEDATIVKSMAEKDFTTQENKTTAAESKGQEYLNKNLNHSGQNSKSSRISRFFDQANSKLGEISDRLMESINQPSRQPNPGLPPSQSSFKQYQALAAQESSYPQEIYYSQIRKTKTASSPLRKEDIVGLYVSKNILLPDDTILAHKGDMITHAMISNAEVNGVLDQILNNATKNGL